jgi:hypothetical protein
VFAPCRAVAQAIREKIFTYSLNTLMRNAASQPQRRHTHYSTQKCVK